MKYTVVLARNAEKEFKELPKYIQEHVTKRVVGLESNPRPLGIKKLSGRQEYRLRVGDYRILYTIDDEFKVVDVSVIEHRKDVYRD